MPTKSKIETLQQRQICKPAHAGNVKQEDIPNDPAERAVWLSRQPTVIVSEGGVLIALNCVLDSVKKDLWPCTVLNLH